MTSVVYHEDDDGAVVVVVVYHPDQPRHQQHCLPVVVDDVAD